MDQLKNGDKVNEFNQEAWLNPYIDMNEHSDKKKFKKSFLKRLFQANEHCSFWKYYRKCEKI